MKRCIATLALALLAFPAAALAVPDELRHLGPQTSVGAPVPADVPAHIRAAGTDVAAPDQQAPAAVPSLPAVSAPSEFDWEDAGIGAAGATFLLALSLAGATTLRRRPSELA